MVFDPDVAPRDRAEFVSWYRAQTEWREDHGYNDPQVCSQALRTWFLHIIKDFPAMNGPYAAGDFDNPKVTDYSVGRSVIYAAFAWSQAKSAYQTVFELARKYGVGFYDVSDAAGKVWLPDSDGEFVCVHADPTLPEDPDDRARRHQRAVNKILDFWKK